LSAALSGNGPAGDDTCSPPEPWAYSPLWDPETVRHVISDSPRPSLGCPGLTYKGEKKANILMPHESPQFVVTRQEGLTTPDGRHHRQHSGLFAPRDISEATADAWVQRGDLKRSRTCTIQFFRWGALSGLPYHNVYRLALHMSTERAAVYLSGYEYVNTIRGLRDQIREWPQTRESVAFKLCDGLFEGNLDEVSCPAPRDPLPQVEWCASNYAAWLLVRFQWATGARSYETEQRAMNLQADGRGRIIDVALLSSQYRQTLERDADAALEKSRRQESFNRSQYVAI
jgi:hypothetical protein